MAASLSEAREQQHRWEGVEHQVFATWVATASAVEDALNVGGESHLGDGVEQGLHGQK
jgi:hypothetical protein